MFYTKPDPVVDYSRLKEMDMYPDYDQPNMTAMPQMNMGNMTFQTMNGMTEFYDNSGVNMGMPMYQNEMIHGTHGTHNTTHVTHGTHDTTHVTHNTSHVTHDTPNTNHVTNHGHNTNHVTPNTNHVTNNTHDTTNVTPNTTNVTTTTTPTQATPSSPQIPFTVAPPAPSGKYVTDDERWQALVDRDPEADGAFIYCVTSTKVYCRPTCSARLALRSNIVYFDTMKEAVAAGYRPCRRCNPDVSEMNSQRRAVGSVCNLIHSLEPDKVPRVKKLAESVGLTLWHFHRLFKRYTGLTPRQYITEFHKRKRLGLPQLQVSKVVTKKSYERQQRRQGGSNGSTPQQSPSVAAQSPEGDVEVIKLEGNSGNNVHNVNSVTHNTHPNHTGNVTHHNANATHHNNGATPNSGNATHHTPASTSSVSSASSAATPLSNTTSPENTTPAQDSAYVIANTNAGVAPPANVAAAPNANWIKTEPALDFMPRYEPRYDQSISIDGPMFIPEGEFHQPEMLGDMWI